MCRVLFNANHRCLQSNNERFLLKTIQQTKENNITGCAQMVPLTRVFSVCSINVLRLHGASHCECVSTLYSERLQLQMVLWSAGSSRYFPVLTAGGRKSASSTSRPPSPVFISSQRLPFAFSSSSLSWLAHIWTSSSHLGCQPPHLFTLIYRLNSFALWPSLLPVLPLFPDSLIWFTTVGALCHRRVATSQRGVGGMMSERANEQVCGHSCVSGSLQDVFVLEVVCACVCLSPALFACVRQRHHPHRCMYLLLSCRESAAITQSRCVCEVLEFRWQNNSELSELPA